MRRLLKLIRTTLLYSVALVLVAGYPIIVMADAPVATPTSVATQPAPPKPTYTYNAATGMWDSNTWQFNPTTGTYEAVPAAPSSVDPTASLVPATTTNQATPATPSTTDSITNKSSTDATAKVDVTNQTAANATTGNATVSANTSAGNATTGDATSTTTLLNNVNSVMTAGDNQKAASFTYNVMGDVNGDIMLYPLLLKSMIESNVADTSKTVTATQTNTLTNTVNLQATSGDATVSGNTSAGNATTGSANTVANVMNILNSMISANRSFIGTINIYGNLHGDILIAPDFIPQMIASNQGSQMSATQQATVQTTDSQTIVNSISLAAKSGGAAVLGNTSAGSATSGPANTNVVIFNLSGHAIVAKDSLLVFVNVLGKWVGVIVDAPTGATSAMIGDGVVANNVVTPDLTVTAKTTNVITNNITLTSQSGDAMVTNNTNAGNALTGNATASANIANISASQLGISDWFGVLFINVFSNWYGSFGVNTPYGDPPIVGVATGSADNPPSHPGVITFVPHNNQSTLPAHKVTLIDSQQLAQMDPADAAILGVTATNLQPNSTVTTPEFSAVIKNDFRFPIIVGSIFIVGLSGLALRRLLANKS
jgi:hypothetical protein